MFSKQYKVDEPALSEDAAQQLQAYHWPGNVRELKNVAERLVIRLRAKE